MPVTRSQTQVPQQRAGRAPQGRGRGGRRIRPPLLRMAPVPGYAGLHYDTQHLSPNSAQTVVEGLRSTFEVDAIEHFEDGRNRYYAFQMKKMIAVRIFNPAGNRAPQDRVECACQAYQRTRTACKHLYWLFGRIHAVLRRDHLAATLRDPREIEVTSRLSELYPFIEERHGSLPKALNEVDADDEDDNLDELAVEDMRA